MVTTIWTKNQSQNLSNYDMKQIQDLSILEHRKVLKFCKLYLKKNIKSQIILTRRDNKLYNKLRILAIYLKKFDFIIILNKILLILYFSNNLWFFIYIEIDKKDQDPDNWQEIIKKNY